VKIGARPLVWGSGGRGVTFGVVSAGLPVVSPLQGLGPNRDRTQDFGRSSLRPGLAYLGPLGRDGVDRYWLMVKRPWRWRLVQVQNMGDTLGSKHG
jgi:hypothetical protein